jgi:hypothetical protein
MITDTVDLAQLAARTLAPYVANGNSMQDRGDRVPPGRRA